MKKLILVVMMILTLCSCGTTKVVEVSSAPPPDAEVEANEDIDFLVDTVDAILRDSFGENFLASNYSEDTGKYMAIITFDGISEEYGSERFYNICGSFDDISITIRDKIGLENVLLLCSDLNINTCLYATDAGEDITYIFT